ncbi:hypothetical protein Tco_1333345, partial [Tanacetum coccineum]
GSSLCFLCKRGLKSILALSLFLERMGRLEIAKVAIGGIRCGVCRQSREERGTMLGVNLAGSKDRHTFSVGDDEQLFPGDLKFGKLAQQAP